MCTFSEFCYPFMCTAQQKSVFRYDETDDTQISCSPSSNVFIWFFYSKCMPMWVLVTDQTIAIFVRIYLPCEQVSFCLLIARSHISRMKIPGLSDCLCRPQCVPKLQSTHTAPSSTHFVTWSTHAKRWLICSPSWNTRGMN